MARSTFRVFATAAVTLGLAAGVTIVAEGSAQAVQAEWVCKIVNPLAAGSVNGQLCQGTGTGVGWFELVTPSGQWINEYRCTRFASSPDGEAPGYFGVSGTGCNNTTPVQ